MAEVTISSLKIAGLILVLKFFGMKQKLRKASDFGIDELVLPRRKRAPLRFDGRTSNTHNEETVEDLYRKYYFEILDTFAGEIDRITDIYIV